MYSSFTIRRPVQFSCKIFPVGMRIGSRGFLFVINLGEQTDHGLYGSTSCCISHGPSQWERAIFDPPQIGDPWTDFHETWNITISRTRPSMQNFRGLRRRRWSVQIASLTHELSFFSFLRHTHRSHCWTHPNAQYVIIRRFRQGSDFWELERWTLKFDPLYAQKT